MWYDKYNPIVFTDDEVFPINAKVSTKIECGRLKAIF